MKRSAFTLVCVLVALAAVSTAQQPPPDQQVQPPAVAPAPTPATPVLAPATRPATAPRPPSPPLTNEQLKVMFANAFKQGHDLAGPGCKAVKGKLKIRVERVDNGLMPFTVECEMEPK